MCGIRNNSNNNIFIILILQPFQLVIIVLARYLLGVPNPSPVSQHALISYNMRHWIAPKGCALTAVPRRPLGRVP